VTTPYERIIETASRLFYQEGINATGIDRVVKESHVAKMSLYKHFSSKDQLILAYLQRRDLRWRTWFEAAVERLGHTPEEKILAIFDALDEWFHEADFRGCAFINATAEFSHTQHPVQEIASEHKRLICTYITDLARAAGIARAEELATQVCLLMDGAITTALVQKNSDAAQQAHHIAHILLANYRQENTI
jgi:AcrR family transcriptional regulator